MLIICRRRLEAEATIETLSVCVDRVRQHRSDANLFRHRESTKYCLAQQAHTNAAPLILASNSQTCENCYRDRIAPHATTNPGRCFEHIELTYRKTYVADDPLGIEYDKGARGAA